ncbi:MAG: CHAT domain-containing protein, partial [Desulfobacterales bacterium]
VLTVNLMPLKAIQASLAPDTHLIEYYLSDRKTIAWVLSHDSFRGFILPVTKTEVQDLIHVLRRNIRSPATQHLDSTASTLYGCLIEPLQPELLRGNRICIVSHGVLHHLPFQILKGSDNYLVQDYTLFYSPSANIYHICKQKRTTKGLTMLAMGDPDLNDPALALPFARKEVKAIQSGFPTAEVYLGHQASKATFLNRAPGFKLIHLAAHGIYNTINPMRSGLLLAGANQDTRLLSAEEVFNCRLNAYLVTLSACETALGKTTGGDELISVTRAFLYAGTPSVVSTLWSVDDEASAHLMISYYDKLRRMDKASALRLAQIETMKVYPNPFYWGAFILNGDWL